MRSKLLSVVAAFVTFSRLLQSKDSHKTLLDTVAVLVIKRIKVIILYLAQIKQFHWIIWSE